MICGVCAIGLHYLILKFLSVNLFLWGHELANSFLLFSVHKSFLQIIKNFSLRHRLATNEQKSHDLISTRKQKKRD